MNNSQICLRSIRDPKIVIKVQANGFRIGRGSINDLVLQNSQVSRQHAIIEYQNGLPTITDLKSSLGTFVNNQRITSSILQSGDKVAFGSDQWIVEEDTESNSLSPSIKSTQKKAGSRRLALYAIGGSVLLVTLLVVIALTTGKRNIGQSSDLASSSGALKGFKNIQPAVIQIFAEGTFAEPEQTYYNVFGAGSGFIIDPSGIAVTNNHVVTGAAILHVFVGGDQTKEYTAKVLGVSECSDLAVIQISGGPFPYLTWSNEIAETGVDVYAAGFPKGNPEYTITRGIVSKSAVQNAATQWASVSHVIMHDATINPGNSGGPLVNTDGEVVGVNYASNSDLNQYFAIGSDLASEVVNHLRTGKDEETLGINGMANIITYSSGTGDSISVPGIWVSSVKSGSPADRIGIKPRDLIMKMENIDLIQSKNQISMEKYCNILRSRNPEDELEIEVLRVDDNGAQLLTGKINGSPLAK
jgi:serine protease Do